MDLDDLLNAPLVINPDDEIKENDVVITEGVVTDDDLLNAPLVIDSNTDEETNIKTDIPEEHEVKEEKEKNIPPSQDTLYSRYKEKYPQLFQNGKLVDFDAAEEIGIISPVSGVATDDEQVTGGHVSTRTKETPFGFMYNTEVESVEVQKENARNNQDFRRIERVAEDFDVLMQLEMVAARGQGGAMGGPPAEEQMAGGPMGMPPGDMMPPEGM